MQKKWATPKLIMLVKGNPEEGVLGGCKISLNAVTGQNVGPQNGWWGCFTPGCANCNNISAWS